MIQDCIAVVHTGDKNEWIWKYWKYYFDQHWDFSRMNVIFLSEEKLIDYDKVISITTGKVSWARGLKNTLKEIKHKYIVYMHEDYFLTAKVDFEVIESILYHMRKKEINIVKCCGKTGGYVPAFKDFTDTSLLVGDRTLKIYNNNTDYLISHQPSIWNREFLDSTVIMDESPWSHEINGTIRLRQRNIPIYVYSSNEDEPNTYPIPYKETVIKGKPRSNCHDYFKVQV